MKFTEEDIKRLVPEFECNGAPGQFYFYGVNTNRNKPLADLLITTRAQLEVAVGALDMVRGCSLNPAHTMTKVGLEDCIDACSKISHEALAKIKELSHD